MILPFENDFYTSIQSVYQKDVPKWNGFEVNSKLFEWAGLADAQN